jgi:CRISPR/Cas system CSM-associated protein Csm4 (group 5 of RAMP superfamily)
MTYKFEGCKYQETKDKSLKEIAQLIRKDLKQYTDNCKKLGYDIKLSVKTQYYSMGQTIHVTIQDTNFNLFNSNFNPNEKINDNNEIYTNKFKKLNEVIHTICSQYNYDDSDSMTDYFSTKFYIHTHMSYKIKKKEKQWDK